MAYSTEVVARARARLAQAREDRESENRQHLVEAYERVPRIREIDMLLRKTMAITARLAFASGADAREAMEQVKEQNLALQREREFLIRENFEEGFLDESPICAHCGGLGYVGSAMCECLRELCRQEQKKEISVLAGTKETFQQFRLDYYSDQYSPAFKTSPRAIMERNFKICRSYAQNFAMNSGNLLFNGGTGVGKTFLSACIARAVADKGYSVVYETSAHLFSKLEQARFNGNEENRRQAEKFTACDLLIVDDLGTEMPGQFVTAALYSLVNDRILGGKPMVISTNLNIDEIRRRYSPQIASRMEGSFQLLPFIGEDIRVLKNRGF
jgi:DNA replication protein DnaC